MASPQNIRAYSPIPFPALVRGFGPITVTKANGIWTIGFDIADLTAHVPSFSDLPVEYVVVYDSIHNTFFKISLASLGLGGASTQRVALASPIVVVGSDQIINFNINAGAPVCTLPASATRNGAPLTFKDAGGHAAAHNLTITPAVGETIDGQPAAVITTNFGQVILVPYNDGTNTGWALR
jgi:hypothetical protein